MCRENKPKVQSTGSGLTAAIIAFIAAVASSLCCVGPLVYLVFGVSAASLTGLSKLGWLQWPMLVLSLLSLGLVFWRLYLSQRPYCHSSISRRTMLILYWLLVAVTLAILFYPFFLPTLLGLSGDS